MRFNLLAVLAVLLLQSLGLVAQPGQAINLPAFNGIDLQTKADVYLSYGPTQQVTVEGPEKWINRLSKTINSKGVWNINCPVSTEEAVRIHIVLPLIHRVALSGVGNIICKDQLNLHQLLPLQPLEVELSGVGDISLNLDCRKIVAHLSGMGNLDLAGKAGILNVTLSGSGNVNSDALSCGSVKIDLSGSGNIDVQVRDWFNASISGSGNIAYRGNPPFNVTQVTGAGSITQRN